MLILIVSFSILQFIFIYLVISYILFILHSYNTYILTKDIIYVFYLSIHISCTFKTVRFVVLYTGNRLSTYAILIKIILSQRNISLREHHFFVGDHLGQITALLLW